MSLVLFSQQNQNAIVVSNKNTSKMEIMARTFGTDLVYISEWLDEYTKQTLNQKSILVFASDNIPSSLVKKLSNIETQKGSNVILFGTISRSDFQFSQRLKYHQKYILEYFFSFCMISSIKSQCNRDDQINHLVNLIRNPQYDVHDFNRNIPLLVQDTSSCLRNKTIVIFFKAYFHDLLWFPLFFVQLEHLLTSINKNTTKVRLKVHQVNYDPYDWITRSMSIALKNNIIHRIYDLNISDDDVLSNVFLYINSNAKYYFRKTPKKYVEFSQDFQGNCQIQDSRGNTFHVKSRDVGNSNEFTSLLLRTLINATC